VSKLMRRGDVSLAKISLCLVVLALAATTQTLQSAAVLASHWKLDEGNGTSTSDSTVSRTGTLRNGVTWTTGRVGAAINLDGQDDYVSLPNLDVSGSAITLSTWVKIASFPSGIDQRFIAKTTNTTEQAHYWMLGTTGNRLRFRLKAGGSTTTLVASSGNLSTNVWYHAAATYDGTTMRLYLNGTQVGSVAKSGTVGVSSSVPVNIGRSPDGSNYMRGAIDDVRIYKSALTQTEVASLASAQAPTTPTPPPPTSTTNKPPTVSLTSPWPGVVFKVGANISVKATAADPGGSVTRVDFYAGSTLIGSDTTSPYGVTWRNVKGGTYTLKATARDNGGASASDTQIVAVGSSTSPPPPTNQPPSVSLTSPANGASLALGINLTVSATASDTNGTIARVQFYAGSILIGTDTTSPYSILWPTLLGTHILKAVATDNAGASTTSATRTVTVGSSTPPPSNQPPSVSLTAPASGASFTAPATITLSATASDTGGSITKVEFYRGTTLIGTDTSSPYSISWTNVAAGSYALTAMAYDNAGARTSSSTRDITVGSASVPTTAVFTPSSNHATVVDRYVVEIFPAGADTRVANPVATRDIGKPAVSGGEIRVNISSTITGLAPGNYVATVTAFSDTGSSQSAASPQFTR
jgi:hypothetical protein